MQNAAQMYAQTAQKTAGPRELEAQLLLRSALRLQDIMDEKVTERTAIRSALEFNRKLWTVIAASATAADNPLPHAIKQNIGNLAVFVLRTNLEMEVQPQPARFRALVSINRELAAGLMHQPAAAA